MHSGHHTTSLLFLDVDLGSDSMNVARIRLSPHALHPPIAWGRVFSAFGEFGRAREGRVICVCAVMGMGPASADDGVDLGDCVASCVDCPLLSPSVSAYGRHRK